MVLKFWSIHIAPNAGPHEGMFFGAPQAKKYRSASRAVRGLMASNFDKTLPFVYFAILCFSVSRDAINVYTVLHVLSTHQSLRKSFRLVDIYFEWSLSRQPPDNSQNVSLDHGISQGIKTHLAARITPWKTEVFTAFDLEKAVGVIMTLDPENSQGVKMHLETMITPWETAILWPFYLKKALRVNTCSDRTISRHAFISTLSIASHPEKISKFADLEKTRRTP